MAFLRYQWPFVSNRWLFSAREKYCVYVNASRFIAVLSLITDKRHVKGHYDHFGRSLFHAQKCVDRYPV